MNELKEKFENANREERIKILSLKPSSWNIQDTANYFGVTRHHVAQALKLKEKKGILPEPKSVGAKCRLSEELKKQVTNFYLGDENSFDQIRIMPGQKILSVFHEMCMNKRGFYCATSVSYTDCIKKVILETKLENLHFLVYDQNNV